MNKIMSQAREIEQDLITIRRTIHSNPEVGGVLQKTKSYVIEKIKEFFDRFTNIWKLKIKDWKLKEPIPIGRQRIE